MKFVSLGALLSCGFLLGCSGVGSESTNDGVLPGQARQALSTPQSFTMTNAYYADSGSSCSSRATKSIAGFEPAETGTYPVFVYLTGTTMTFNGADAQNLTQEMATRGFVAATAAYNNGTYPLSCSTMTTRAKCIFDASSANSAITKICSRPKADCAGKGIVVSGFSQGANLASLAKNYDSRMRAAYLLGHGGKGASGINLQSCLQDSANVFASSEMRVVDGDHDGFFGSNPDGVRSQLELATSYNCAGWNCIQPDGSGWYMVQGSELQDGNADHCYFYSNANSTCSSFTNIDPGWDTGASVWEKNPDLDWLVSHATP